MINNPGHTGCIYESDYANWKSVGELVALGVAGKHVIDQNLQQHIVPHFSSRSRSGPTCSLHIVHVPEDSSSHLLECPSHIHPTVSSCKRFCFTSPVRLSTNFNFLYRREYPIRVDVQHHHGHLLHQNLSRLADIYCEAIAYAAFTESTRSAKTGDMALTGSGCRGPGAYSTLSNSARTGASGQRFRRLWYKLGQRTTNEHGLYRLAQFGYNFRFVQVKSDLMVLVGGFTDPSIWSVVSEREIFQKTITKPTQ